MNKYEDILKHLGKENNVSANEVEKKLNSERPEPTNSFSEANLDNIDSLINLKPSQNIEEDSVSLSENNNLPSDGAPLELSPDLLKELEHLDAPPPDIQSIFMKQDEGIFDTDNSESESSSEETKEGKQEDDSADVDSDFSFSEPGFDLEDAQSLVPENVSNLFDNFNISGQNSQETLAPELPEISDLPTIEEENTKNENSALPDSFDFSDESMFNTNNDTNEPSLDIESSDSIFDFPMEESSKVQESPIDLNLDDFSKNDQDANFEIPKDPFGDFSDISDISAPSSQPNDFNIDLNNETFENNTDAPSDDFQTNQETESVPELDFNIFDTAQESIGVEFENNNIDFNPPNEDTNPEYDEFKSNENNENNSQETTQNSSQLDIDPEKAIEIRNKINQYKNPILRKKLRKILIEDLLPSDQLNTLFSGILLNESEDALLKFIDEQLPDMEVIDETAVIEESEEPKKAPRKIIYAEDALRAKEFQQELEKIVRYAGILFVILIFAAVFIWRIIWVPSNANKYYQKGMIALINENYPDSESYFDYAFRKAGPKLDWYIKFADAYIKKKKNNLAEKKFAEGLKYFPNNMDIIMKGADFYKTMPPFEFDKAIKLYDRLRKKNPKDFKIIDLMGVTYIEWADRTIQPEIKTKYYNEANNLYLSYLSKKPKDLNSYFRLLSIAMKFKDNNQIFQFYDIIDKINPKAINLDVLTDLSRYLVDIRELERAKKVFDKIIPYSGHLVQQKLKSKMEIDQINLNYPSISEAYFQYARYLTLNINYEKAMQSIEKALTINKKHGQAYNLLGEIFYISESIPHYKSEAKKQFEYSIGYTPNYYKAYANLGHLFFYDKLNISTDISADNISKNLVEKNESMALKYYEIAKQKIPHYIKDFLLNYNLAWLYYKNQLYDYAFREWVDLYVDEPYNPALSYAVGNTYYHQKKYSLAKIQYDKAIEYYQAIADRMAYINPQLERHQEIYLQLARCYNNRGVINVIFGEQSNKLKANFEQQALLDFYRSKDSVNKIDALYENAEVNIKHIINKGIKNRRPAFDDTIPMRTSLQKWIDEFKQKIIQNL